MLALTFFRYWWLQPRIQDPQTLETSTHESLTKSMTSLMEPLNAPQFETQQNWAKISFGTEDSLNQSVIEIEKALAKGKNMILIEPSIAGRVYTHYVSHGWLLQKNTVFYGGIGLFVSFLFPNKWSVYIPCSLLSLMHSWVYFKVYKQDRLSQYQAYDDDKRPISNVITNWVQGQRPDHFQYVLRKKHTFLWEIISEVVMYSSIISSLVSLKSIEGTVVGNRYVLTQTTQLPLDELLSLPAYSSGYFQPPELVPVAPGYFLPADISTVKGWFDLPWFGVRVRPLKYDLAVIYCALGSYLAYKLFDHFFGYSEVEENDGDEVEEASSHTCRDEYWVEIGAERNGPGIEADMLDSKTRLENVSRDQEEKTIARLSRQVPYGWVRPGYSENHYGVFK